MSGLRFLGPILACLAILATLAAAGSAHAGTVFTGPDGEQSIWVEGEHGDTGRFDTRRITTELGCQFSLLHRIRGDVCEVEENISEAEFEQRLQDENIREFDRNEGTFGSERTTAPTLLFKYAMGVTDDTGPATCISCDFLAFFMIGLTDFSDAVFQYLIAAFELLVPILIAIWIGYRVAKIMSTGGEDGKSFVYSLVAKLALFAMIWLLATATTAGKSFMWTAVGPTYLDYAFRISGEIRDTSIRAVDRNPTTDSGGAPTAPFGCDGVSSRAAATVAKPDFVQPALEVGCVTERTHMIGLASGLAVVYSAFRQGNISVLSPVESVTNIVVGIIKLAAGFLMMCVFLISAVWLIFLILDIVVRGLVTAALSPLVAAMYLFQPTRGFAANALKAMGGAVITAIALSIISVLAFVLLSNVVTVYNASWDALPEAYKTAYSMDYIGSKRPPGEDIANQNTAQYLTFVERIQESDPDDHGIPMDFTTPWFYYICLSGIAIFALGKKIIAMLEGMIGYQGASGMADNALKNLKTAGGFAGGLTAGAVALGRMGMSTGVGSLGFLGGGAAGAAGAAASGAGNIGQRMGGNPNRPHANPFTRLLGGEVGPRAGKVLEDQMNDPEQNRGGQ